MTNKNKNIGLQDFIIEKTSNNSSNTDVLSGLTPPVKKEEPVKETITRPAVKIEETPKVEAKVKDDFEENPKQTEEEKVPDWLKGALDTENLAKEEIPAEPVKEEAPIKKPKKKPTSDKKDETPTKTTEKKEDLWDNGMDIPDWLKSDNTPAKKDDFWTLDEANQDWDNSQTKKE
mgnify:CR=1 FL=1